MYNSGACNSPFMSKSYYKGLSEGGGAATPTPDSRRARFCEVALREGSFLIAPKWSCRVHCFVMENSMFRKKDGRRGKRPPSSEGPTPSSAEPAGTSAPPVAPASATPPPNSPNHRCISGRRRWLFRLVAVVFPFALLAGIEFSLRVFGYGLPMQYCVKRDIAGQAKVVPNPHFTWQFFGPRLARYVVPSR